MAPEDDDGRTWIGHGITPCKIMDKYRSDPQGKRATYSPKRDSQTGQGTPPGVTNDTTTNSGTKLNTGIPHQ